MRGGFGQVEFEEAAVLAVEQDEGVDGLDDAGACGPAAADTGGQGDDGDLAVAEGGAAAFDGFGRDGARGVEEVGVVDVADIGIDGEAVTGEVDAAFLVVEAELFVLDGVEAIFAADAVGVAVPVLAWGVDGRAGDGEEVVDHVSEDAGAARGVSARAVDVVVEVDLSQGVDAVRAR